MDVVFFGFRESAGDLLKPSGAEPMVIGREGLEGGLTRVSGISIEELSSMLVARNDRG
jgi:hypothetical protein